MLKVWGRSNSTNVQETQRCCPAWTIAFEGLDVPLCHGVYRAAEHIFYIRAGRLVTASRAAKTEKVGDDL